VVGSGACRTCALDERLCGRIRLSQPSQRCVGVKRDNQAENVLARAKGAWHCSCDKEHMQPHMQPARRSTKHGLKLSTLACGLLLLPAIIVTLVGADAEACTISRDSGYLEGVSIERVLVPDTTSPRLTCQRPGDSTCDDQRTHDKIAAAYRVNLITKRVRGDAARGYYAYGESLVLRDQAGNKIDVINRELFNRVNNFESTRLGAQVCVPLATHQLPTQASSRLMRARTMRLRLRKNTVCLFRSRSSR
jgi:hypothetical protein